ncbi:sulfotransferase [Trichodesmium erythraeum IMS101]|uniref:Sulfotransferase n=1 Tax=Trichodesmium erythraeum (strain IMS101) TaxID=203124 RepID=Q111F8_TRIEI
MTSKLPIIMIGTQRSGSNLLRLILNEISIIAAPHPPHIIQRLMPLLFTYGDLSVSKNFKQLVNDTCQLIKLNPVPWERIKFDRNNILSRCMENTLVAVFSSVYDIYAEAWDAKIWCCKSLANVHYFPQINAYLPNAKYLYLYRDGRDVAVSFKEAVVGQKHFFHIAQQWRKDQHAALKIKKQLRGEQFFSLSYEDLINSPELSLYNLCGFLELEFSPTMLDFYNSREASNTSSSSTLWSNVSKPIIKKNSNKFLSKATKEEVKIFESVAGDVLDSLGYERNQTNMGEFRTFSQEEIAQFDLQNEKAKAQVRDMIDVKDKKRREQQLSLLEAIKSRCSLIDSKTY